MAFDARICAITSDDARRTRFCNILQNMRAKRIMRAVRATSASAYDRAQRGRKRQPHDMLTRAREVPRATR